jgi:ATP-dependent DNA helicase RecQ
MSLADIAAARGLTLNTIEGHLVEAMESGEQLDIERLVDDDKRRAIEAVLTRLGSALLRPVREQLGESYSYSEIRFVRAWLASRA